MNEILEFPKSILIDTVSFCNLRCSMCFHKNMKRKKRFMSWDLYTKIIDEIAQVDKNTRVWEVFFGDPYVRARKKPTIFDMIKYAKDCGLTDVVVNTNACLMGEENAKKIIKSGLDEIYIGIDAFNDSTYRKVRVGGDYQQTVNNVLRLLELKKNMNVDHPRVFVQFVEMNDNIDQKEDFINFWTNAGAIAKIRPMISWAGKIETTSQQTSSIIDERFACGWALNTLSIIDTGDVVTCAVDLDGDHSFGNVYEKSIKEIWDTTVKEFREKHLNHKWDELHDLCKNCMDWQGCKRELIET